MRLVKSWEIVAMIAERDEKGESEQRVVEEETSLRVAALASGS